jgi:hypothetical protein
MMITDYHWFDLVITASNEELQALLGLARNIKLRHPGIDTDQLLDFATDAERESIDRIRARVAGRWAISQESVPPAPARSISGLR